VAVVTTDGHSWSWPELFDKFGPPIRSYATSRGVRTPDDVVQDVFVVAVEKLQQFEGDPSGLRSLLFTIAYRRIADEHRRFYRRAETLVPTHAPTPDSGPLVEDIVSSRDSVDQAMQAFSVLNTRERHVLEMRIFLDATPAQVAASIGVSSGNVRVIQSRALSKIRKHLESLRNESASRTTATVVALFDAIRYLRDELPSEGLLGQWIDGVRYASANAAGASAAISGGVAASSAAGAGAGSAAASVASTSVVASAAVKLTMIITLAAASTIGAGVIATGSESVVPNGSAVSDEVEVSRGQQDPEMASPETVTYGSEESVETAPPSSANSRTSSPVGTATDTGSDRVVPFAPELVEPGAGLIEDAVDTVSEDVVDPLVGAVVDEVVDPLLGAVVDVVDPLVEDVVDPIVGTVVDDVVDPLVRSVVDDVVDPLVDPVDDLVAPLVDDVLDPLVDDLVEDLELPPILGGLLGA
jgi:RNA polymerase sigma-70 factor (ECF subfamily)